MLETLALAPALSRGERENRSLALWNVVRLDWLRARGLKDKRTTAVASPWGEAGVRRASFTKIKRAPRGRAAPRCGIELFPRRAAALGEDLSSVNTRLRLLLAFTAAAVVVLAALAVVFPREPTYQKRQLSAWLRDLENGGPEISVRNVRAREAVRQIVSNGVPCLLKMLRVQDPSWKTEVVGWLRDKCSIDWSFSLANVQWHRAIIGFDMLGRAAEPAIPELRAMISGADGDLALRAAEALRGIGGPATTQFFLEALNSTNLPMRGEAIGSLGRFRSGARAAVPALLQELHSNEPTLRLQAARALGEIALDAGATVPALTRCLSDRVGGVKAAAAASLGSFGTNAMAALPALRALGADPDETLRRAARFATVRVQCETRDGAIIRGPRDQKRIALVFTGHEFGEGGETILDELARHRSRASFFLTGAFLTNSQFAALVGHIQDEWHYLGPHSDRHLLYCEWTEPRRTLVQEDQFQEDLLANAAKIPGNSNDGRRYSRYFLPPFEHYNREIADWTRANGWTLISFTPGTRANADYTGETDQNFVSSQEIFDSIVACEREDPDGLNGFILLLHLGAGPGRADKFHARLGELLDQLAGRGYEFVRVDELLRPPREPGFTNAFPRSFRSNR